MTNSDSPSHNITTLPSCTGKYVTSLLDGETYCRKNGSFLRHLRSKGYTYETYVNEFYTPKAKCIHCEEWATFVPSSMSYKDTCGSIACRNLQIATSKRNRTGDQWDAQREAFRQTMSTKTTEELQAIKQNRINTYRKKHGVDHRLQQQLDPNVLSKLSDRDWMVTQHHQLKKTAVKIAEELGCGVTTATNWIHRHGIQLKRYRCSQVERDIIKYLESIHSGTIITSDRTVIAPYEVDIYLQNCKLAIEVNGIYWHGELSGKGRRYHLDKQIACQQAGVRLIHITDEEWIQRTDIVKSRISNMLGLSTPIYARQCTIQHLTSLQANDFLNINHIQGSTQHRHAYGLFHHGTLVAVCTFGIPRFTSNAQYELIRYANALGYRVIGGASRLFRRFVKDVNATNVVTYSDRRWNTGNMYSALGFKYSHTSSPNYMYFHRHRPFELKSRHQFQKHKLRDKLSNFDPNQSEWENMVDNGYDRIWDCGNDVWYWAVDN